MDSGIVRTSSISSRNRDRAVARREVQEELNLAHMKGVMKSVRHTAREQGSGRSRVVLEEHTPSSPSHSSKAVLRIETKFHKVCPDYYKLGPSITEKKHGRVSTPVRGEDADRRQNAEERRHSQRSRISHSENMNLVKAVEEQIKETPALRRQKPTLQLRADFATTPEYPPMDPQAPKNKHLGLSCASKGDTDPRQTAQPRSYSQRIKESQPKDTSFSPAVEERSKESPAPMRQRPTLQIQTDPTSAEHLAQPDYRQINPYASQNEQRRVSAPIIKKDIDQCQIMEIISLYEEVREEMKEIEHQGTSSPVDKKFTDRCQDYKQDRSGETSQRPRLVDIVRQGLAESEAGSPTLNPSRSASLYGDYSCIYEEYSD